MNKSVIILAISFALVLSSVNSVPQNVEQYRYQPYSYEYSVQDPEQQLFHDKAESSDDSGKVVGRYSVLLPDGRLMIVEYTASKETGFVPKISFVDNANPFSG